MDASPIDTLHDIGQIAIVGTGLLGGSIGLGLKKAGYRGSIIGIGRRESSLQTAIDKGCIDRSLVIPTDAPADDAAGLWRFDGPTLIVLATPISQFEAHFKQLGHVQKTQPGTPLYITDAGSTKSQVCQWAREHLHDATCFLGAHPMAGSEKQGASHADANLFHGRPCLLTPESNIDPDCRKYVEALWRSLGMRLVTMTAQQHDRAAAAISHLPHALAMLLVLNASSHEHALAIAAGGFRDTTRVASGDVAVWKDIFMSNRHEMTAMIDQFMASLATLRDQLSQSDDAAIRDQLERAKTIRDQWASHLQQGGSLPSSPSSTQP